MLLALFDKIRKTLMFVKCSVLPQIDPKDFVLQLVLDAWVLEG